MCIRDRGMLDKLCHDHFKNLVFPTTEPFKKFSEKIYVIQF
jgi:hypothetical protein